MLEFVRTDGKQVTIRPEDVSFFVELTNSTEIMLRNGGCFRVSDPYWKVAQLLADYAAATEKRPSLLKRIFSNDGLTMRNAS